MLVLFCGAPPNILVMQRATSKGWVAVLLMRGTAFPRKKSPKRWLRQEPPFQTNLFRLRAPAMAEYDIAFGEKLADVAIITAKLIR